MTDYPTFAYGDEAVRQAIRQSILGRLSYGDAPMLAPAAEAGCTVMLSKDMQDGATLFGLEIVNPFATGGVSPRIAELLDIA